MTRQYEIAPGVQRLRAGEQRQRSGKRVTHWLTVTAVLVKPRKPKPVVGEQQALF